MKRFYNFIDRNIFQFNNSQITLIEGIFHLQCFIKTDVTPENPFGTYINLITVPLTQLNLFTLIKNGTIWNNEIKKTIMLIEDTETRTIEAVYLDNPIVKKVLKTSLILPETLSHGDRIVLFNNNIVYFDRLENNNVYCYYLLDENLNPLRTFFEEKNKIKILKKLD